MIFVLLKLFVTTPTHCCEISFLFEKEFALTIITVSKKSCWYEYILKELTASSVYYILKINQAKNGTLIFGNLLVLT